MRNSYQLKEERAALESKITELCSKIEESGDIEFCEASKPELEMYRSQIMELDEEKRQLDEKIKEYTKRCMDFSTPVVNNNNVKTENRSMTNSSKVSLLGLIRKAKEGGIQDYTDEERSLLAEGTAMNERARSNYGMGPNVLNIPVYAEDRAMFKVTGSGNVHDDVVETDIQHMLSPLRANNVLAKAGAKFLTGLTSDISYPVMSASNVFWTSENGNAVDGSGSISSVTFKPFRVAAYIDISNQLLIQDSSSAEQTIINDLVNAVGSKLEATILGNESDDPNHFSLFYNQTPTSITSYADLCNLEATVAEANVYGKMTYLVSPGAKAKLRTMSKSTKVTQLVLEGGNIDGTPVYDSTLVGKGVGSGTPFVQSGNLIYGDFSNLVIGQWGGLGLKVINNDTPTAMGEFTRLIVNARFGVGVLRPQAFAFGLV